MITGYNNSKLIDLKICEYNLEQLTSTLEGDIDTIKVFAFSQNKTLVPICEHEVITKING